MSSSLDDCAPSADVAAPSADVAKSSSLRDVIFNPMAFARTVVQVSGTVVLLDKAMGRMDISRDGAKLIVQLDKVDAASTACPDLQPGALVAVSGRIKKQQRRTFMEACGVRVEEVAVATAVLTERNAERDGPLL